MKVLIDFGNTKHVDLLEEPRIRSMLGTTNINVIRLNSLVFDDYKYEFDTETYELKVLTSKESNDIVSLDSIPHSKKNLLKQDL